MAHANDERDRAVLLDPLAPPLNRNAAGSLAPPARTRPGSDDTYRLVAYLVEQEDRNDVWKLFARERYRGGGQADFYASNANHNFDVKVPITQDMVKRSRERLRDVYALPNTLVLDHPMFNPHSQYAVMALPYDMAMT